MITVLIAENEEKIKNILRQMLKQGGVKQLDMSNQENIIKMIKEDSIKDTVSLKERIVELEESLFKEKQGILYKCILEVIEKPLIEYALERTEGNQLKAAKILGLNRNTIRTKIKKLGIEVSRWKVSQ